MDFIPQPQKQNSPPPTYELKKDVMGDSSTKKDDLVLTDKNGTKVRLPYAPNKKCKKCLGKGYLGINVKTGRFVVCHKCYKPA